MWSRWNEPIKLKKVLYITCIYMKNPSCIQRSHAVPNPPSSHLSVQFKVRLVCWKKFHKQNLLSSAILPSLFSNSLTTFNAANGNWKMKRFFSTESFGILKFHAVSKRFFVDHNGEVGKNNKCIKYVKLLIKISYRNFEHFLRLIHA